MSVLRTTLLLAMSGSLATSAMSCAADREEPERQIEAEALERQANEFLARSQERLERLEVRIRRLRAIANEIGDEEGERLRDRVQELEDARRLLAERLRRTGVADRLEWVRVKAEIEKDFSDLERLLEDAFSRTDVEG